MQKQKLTIITSFFLGVAILIGVGSVFAGNAIYPGIGAAPFSVEATIPLTPGSTDADTASTTRVMQVNGANIRGIIVNQKSTDNTSRDNYVQLYDDVNAWGQMNILKGVWNIALPNNGLALEQANANFAKKIFGIQDAKAGMIFDTVNGTQQSAIFPIDANQSQYSTGAKNAQSLPFLQTVGANIRGIIVNQADTDTTAEANAIELYDYSNVWGYMNLRDGLWNMQVAAAAPPSIAISLTTPVAGVVLTGTTGFDVFRFDFSAGGQNRVLNSLTIQMTGTASASDISSLKLIDTSSGAALSTATLNASKQATFTNINRVITAGTSARFSVQVDIANCATVGATFQFNTVSSDPAGAGTATGNMFTIANGGTCLSSNASLSGLTENLAASLSPAFSSGTISYTLAATSAESSVNITATRSQSGATIKINGTTVTSGTAKAVTLSTGANTINVVVTAQDGVTIKTYTITVNRAAAAGTLQITKATTSPAGAVISKGTPDYTFTELNFSASGGSISVSSVTIRDYGSAGLQNLTDLKLYAGSNLLGTIASPGTTATFTLSPTMNIAVGGTQKVSIVATLPCSSAATTNSKIQLGVSASTPSGGTASGNQFTVGTECEGGAEFYVPPGTGGTGGKTQWGGFGF